MERQDAEGEGCESGSGDSDSEPEYTVARILGERQTGEGQVFLVQWAPPYEDEETWEPRCHVGECAAMDEWAAEGVDQ